MRIFGILMAAVLFLDGVLADESARSEPSQEAERYGTSWPQGVLGPPGSVIEQYHRSRIIAYLEQVERETPCVWPVDDLRITYTFGAWRYWEDDAYRPPELRKNYRHMGLDIDGATGDPIRSACGGRVVFAGWQEGYGCTVQIQARAKVAGGWTDVRLLYAHQFSRKECRGDGDRPSMLVQVGERVRKGQQIGVIGNSGNAIGDHLHVSAYRDQRVIDPCDVLPCDSRGDGLADSQ